MGAPPKNPKSDQTEICIYIGRRLWQNGKVYQTFQRPDKSEMNFKGVRASIGYTYRCGKSNIMKRPEGVETPRIDNPEWDAADALAANALKTANSRKKYAAASSPALKAAIAAFIPLCRNLGYIDVHSLAKVIAERAYDATHEPKKRKRK